MKASLILKFDHKLNIFVTFSIINLKFGHKIHEFKFFFVTIVTVLNLNRHVTNKL